MFKKIKKSSNITLIAVLVLSFVSFFIFNQRKTEINIASENEDDSGIDMFEESADGDNSEMIVDVKGEVENPGIYDVSEDMRVNDVINLAGGLTTDADDEFLNLAEKVTDEMIIYVPSNILGETSDGVSSNNPSNKIKLNQATKDELTQLTGIGPSKAEAIIKHREDIGKFKNATDLLDVSGIGEKTLEIIKDEIQVP